MSGRDRVGATASMQCSVGSERILLGDDVSSPALPSPGTRDACTLAPASCGAGELQAAVSPDRRRAARALDDL